MPTPIGAVGAGDFRGRHHGMVDLKQIVHVGSQVRSVAAIKFDS